MSAPVAERPRPVLFLELNEVNFEFLRTYAGSGELPTFHRLLERHGYARTSSESKYEELEPWIQWVTAHTGKTLSEHGIFRLGDIVNHDIPQVWERFEAKGLKVAAISPMNAKHRVKNPAFFVPDPWTATDITAPATLRSLHRAIVQVVNDNAQGHVSARSLLDLLRGILVYAAPSRLPQYAWLAATSVTRPWRRAMLLDLLLADVFLKEVRRTGPDFATLFVNAAAHIQHHYLFCSSAYRGSAANPAWYVEPGADPVREVYRLYDSIVRDVLRRFPDARVMVGTGLHQIPHDSVTFYWRPRDHAQLMQALGIAEARIEPRMSRDFLLSFPSTESARSAQRILDDTTAEDGAPLFEVDNRGRDLFVMFVYPRDIGPDAALLSGGRRIEGLRELVAFVALKNGRHDGTGYFVDTGARLSPEAPPIPLASMPDIIAAALAAH
jgi:hypothetical protein